ncbi:MAG: preprotein translocase subunit SecA [Oscillospiraceae bacterium]|jgi:preprotein translocase subunit SecA|nr:preprotein translocase subunit SecA [Oscillospiraceae bacterium]
MGLLDNIRAGYSKKEIKRLDKQKQAVLALEETMAALSDAELQAYTPKLRQDLAEGKSLDDILPEAFAVCREAAWRVLKMKHYPVQVVGGILLHQGRIAEMRTGEGKTLVATLPAYLNGLTGDGVHIVTVNDYLARRDSEWMGKIYRFLGLKVGLIVHDLDNELRREAYAADITYGTNNEMGFDYLRDNMVQYKEQKVQRGHVFAIVDEVDSILIDEARTPLIISGRGEASTELYSKANAFARKLTFLRIKELNDKQNAEDVAGDADVVVDEKARSATLTAAGVAKAEKVFGLENLMDVENQTIAHHINQAIRAHGVMKCDVDYMVKDGEVLIIDEFTGRIMYGRRYNEGLHQAIEAKEGVKIENESKTLATITFQNYFRLYTKLSGMTGTAITERDEFREIYNLDVVETPTNKPMIRTDHPDSVYRTERAKYLAILEQIRACHERMQPVLVGTVSVEKSELLSALLRREGIKHNVLNAKNHEREAEFVAQAGRYGQVTIATNMAGRGTDIILGGNAEYMALHDMRVMRNADGEQTFTEEQISEATGFAETHDEGILQARAQFADLEAKHKAEIKEEARQVIEVGGLFILGTERHESRRIDNQLRGRAGRQGDPGESRFFLSLEDDLMRLFGGERLSNMMQTLNAPEDMPIEAKMVTNAIENAQKKIEGQNFAIRKNVLKYDDVMNRQRNTIYGQRNQVLDGADLKPVILKMAADSITENVSHYLPKALPQEEWNLAGLRQFYLGWLVGGSKHSDSGLLVDEAFNAQLENPDPFAIQDFLIARYKEEYQKREAAFGATLMRSLERMVLLRAVDTHWMDHIDAMEELKRGIGLRAYAQQDPVVAYRMESYDMFDEMSNNIREDTVKLMLTLRVRTEADTARHAAAQEAAPPPPPGTGAGGDGTDKPKPVRKSAAKVGPNEPCPCGSGKKYKKCHGAV